MAFIYFWISLC